ncbi:MAG: hypothetical protein AAGC68_12640 [Verrucomicrobiota bacterium]
MRLPFTGSELSVFKSAARILAQGAGLLLVLAGLWGISVMIERELNPPPSPDRSPEVLRRDSLASLIDLYDSIEESAIESSEEIDLPITELELPYRATISHEDGRAIDVLLLARPNESEVLVQRIRDDRVFAIDLSVLSPETRDLARRFPAPSASAKWIEWTRDLFPAFVFYELYAETNLKFPHDCLLVSSEGKTLKVTLLARPSPDELRLRRRHDGEIFTIPIHRLSKTNQKLIRQFPIDLEP